MTRDGDKWIPHGSWHARRVGDLQTACGLPATDWHSFWTLRFEDAMEQGCLPCQEAVRDIAEHVRPLDLTPRVFPPPEL